ncbi:hypothetical protein HDV63DRAFT_82397 [Trichoderma sp. SZMC 28014]
MALVIGLVAAAARALASDHNGNGQNYNSNNNGYSNSYNNGYNNGYDRNGYTRGYNNGYANNNYNGNNAPHAPYAAYGSCTLTGSRRGTRRMERRMRKAERKAERNDMIMSLMSSGSRSRAAAPSQPVSGVSYTNYGEGPAPRAVSSSQAQGSVAGSYRDRMPSGAPEGYRWRDEQSRDGQRDLDGLPSYEQAVQKPRKS